jgi:NTE family protein
MSSNNNMPKKQRALVLQGGGGLGAYEVGAFKVLCEEIPKIDEKNGEEGKPLFDVIAGTSIGAINAAILVSHFKQNKSWQGAHKKLENFWKHISSVVDVSLYTRYWKEQHMPYPNAASPEAARRYYSTKQFQRNGAQNVFSPPEMIFDEKFFDNTLIPNNIWFRYSNYPLRDSVQHIDEETGQRFIDFPISTNPERGEPRLLAVSVDVSLGATVTFDSYSNKSVYGWYDKQSKKYEEHIVDYQHGMEISHLMASASIPIFYDYEKIDGRAFWDGAMLSNTPLRELLQHHRGYWHKQRKVEVPELEVYIVNVWPSKEDNIPSDRDGVVDRYHDIGFSDRTDHDEKVASLVSDYIEFVNKIRNLALEHITTAQGQAKFNRGYDAFLNTEALSRNRRGERRKYKSLTEGRFKLTKEVFRIERRDDKDNISNKFADFTTQTISRLIKEGENDARSMFRA